MPERDLQGSAEWTEAVRRQETVGMSVSMHSVHV